MASANPFELLVDDDNDDPRQLLASQQPKVAAAVQAKKPQPPAKGGAAKAPPAAKMPSKPLPPTQAVRDAKSENVRGGFRGEGRGNVRGRGAGGFNRDSFNNENRVSGNTGFSGGYNRASEYKDNLERPSDQNYGGPRGGGRGNRRDGFTNGEAVEGERPRRVYERRSGTGRGNEIKRDGSGRGNWGSPTDEIAPEVEENVNLVERSLDSEKQFGGENAADSNKENPVKEAEEKEEDKEMTLEEYQKVLEEKRKVLLAPKSEERKVNVDKELQSMLQLSSKKGNDDVFIKLGSEKDKRKEAADKEDKVKKSVSINEFLKPSDGERYHGSGGRGRGRGRGGSRGYEAYPTSNTLSAAPAIEDRGQFPTLAAK